MIEHNENTKEMEWESKLGSFILTQENSTKKIKVYNEYENFICELEGFYIVDVTDETALDYYRFIEDLKFNFRSLLYKAKRMIDIASNNPYVFEATITFNGNEEAETQICCFCNLGQYDKLANNEFFDVEIFYYFHDENDFMKMFLGQGDFVLNDFDMDAK